MTNEKEEKTVLLDFNKMWRYPELSAYTGIPESTLEKMVALGEIPSVKMGKHRLFHPRKIDQFFMRKSS